MCAWWRLQENDFWAEKTVVKLTRARDRARSRDDGYMRTKTSTVRVVVNIGSLCNGLGRVCVCVCVCV